MAADERVKALLPPTIGGETHQQLQDKSTGLDKMAANQYLYGVKFPVTVRQSNLDALKTFQVRDSDVFFFSYPRSGTHWVAEIVQFVLNEGKGGFDRTYMSAGLEMTIAADPSLNESATPGYKIYTGMASPRCIGGHCPEQLLPPQVFEKQAKVVYVARNPKDMLVSMYKIIDTALQVPSQLYDFNTLLWDFYCDQTAYGSWFNHVLSYWKHRNDANFLFLKYEDLHKDLKGSICQIADHLGKNLSDDVIDTIVDRVTLSGMRKTYQRMEEEGGDEAKKITHVFGVVPHLRQGKVGGWKNVFTVDQNDLFDKIYEVKMRGTGLKFDFELW